MTAETLRHAITILLDEHMSSVEYDDEVRQKALQLLDDFIEASSASGTSLRRQAKTYAAGIEYALTYTGVTAMTQQEIATAYGVSVSSVASASSDIVDALQLEKYSVSDMTLSAFRDQMIDALENIQAMTGDAGGDSIVSKLLAGIQGELPSEELLELLGGIFSEQHTLEDAPRREARWFVHRHVDGDETAHMIIYDVEQGHLIHKNYIDEASWEELKAHLGDAAFAEGALATSIEFSEAALHDVASSPLEALGVSTSLLAGEERDERVSQAIDLWKDGLAYDADDPSKLPPGIEEFHEAMGRLHDIQPWMNPEHRGELFAVHIEATDERAYLSLLGRDDQARGFQLCESVMSFHKFSYASIYGMGHPKFMKYVGDALGVFLTGEDYFHRDTVAALKARGLEPIDDMLYPAAIRFSDEIPTGEDQRHAAAIASACMAFIDADPKAKRKPYRYAHAELGPISVRHYDPVEEVKPTLALKRHLPRESDPRQVFHDRFFYEERTPLYIEGWLYVFERSAEYKRLKHSKTFDEIALHYFLEYSIDYGYGGFIRLSVVMLHELLCSLFPTKAITERMDPHVMRETFVGFFKFLERTLRLDRSAHIEYLNDPAFLDMFTDALHNEDIYGLAKSTFMNLTQAQRDHFYEHGELPADVDLL